MLANSAATLPRGKALVETYVFDQIRSDAQLLGSLTYLLYGVTDRLTVGVQPLFGIRSASGRELAPGIGDLTLSGQYRLTSPSAAAGTPTIALSLQHSLPIGRFDELDTRPASGLGSGSHVTTLSLYGQQYFWLPNGRIFRARLNLSRSFAGKAEISGESVYGTKVGFCGTARPGGSFSIGVSGEYSVTRSWAAALDLVFSRSGSTRVSGYDATTAGPVPLQFRSGFSETFAIAPGIEYSWTPNIGVLLAARFVPRSRNTTASVTPAVAINYVF